MSNQGSLRWQKDRMGIITASEVKAAIGSVKARDTYIAKLADEIEAISYQAEDEYLAERMLDVPAMRHGRRMEPLARQAYCLEMDVEVKEVGLMVHPDHYFIAASLDGIVDDKTIIEIKSPYREHVHIHTCLLGMPKKHYPQVQCCLSVSGRDQCDFISFCPAYEDQPLYIERIYRDEKYIDEMVEKSKSLYEDVIKRA